MDCYYTVNFKNEKFKKLQNVMKSYQASKKVMDSVKKASSIYKSIKK